MQVTSGIQCNLLSPSYSTIYAPQGDAKSRFVLIQLLEGATPWEVPAGASVIIRAAKPDGTICMYDTNEAGESAYSVSGSTVTIELVGQVLTAPGPVLMQIDFYNSDGAHLSTFTFCCQVSESVVSDDDIVSSNYFSVLTATLTEMLQIEQAVKAAYGAPLVAATAAAMTDHTRIYVYTGNESGYTNGNWYYWDGSAWASGGVYNSSAINVDSAPTQGSTNPVSSGGVYAADAELAGELDDVKSVLGDNLVDFIAARANQGAATRTHAGVTYTREAAGATDNNTFSVSGTATGTSFCNVLGSTSAVDLVFTPGLDYTIINDSTDPGILLHFNVYATSGNTSSDIPGGSSAVVKIPSDVTGCLARYQVNTGTTVDGTASFRISGQMPSVLYPDADYLPQRITLALALLGKCTLAPGVFTIDSTIVMPEGTTLTGFGKRSVLMLGESLNNAVLLFSSHCTISNLAIFGAAEDITVEDFQPGVTRIGIACRTQGVGDVTIDNVEIAHFSHSAIHIFNTGTPVDSGTAITNCYIHNCCAGIYFAYDTEFNNVCNCTITRNYYGYYNRGGNNYVSNCGLDANVINVQIDADAGSNGGHGSIANCSINHAGSNTGYGIIIKDTGRMLITGCNIYYGKVRLENTNGNVFNGCGFGQNNTWEIVGGSCNIFANCMLRGLNAENTTISITNNTHTIISNCYTRYGTLVTVPTA